MTEDAFIHPALLPAGFRDVLPPEAEVEARSIEAIMDCFAAHGYQRVEPPLLEFEDSLFSGSGAATADQTFRLMDMEGQRMMGLRADTTPQIARLASTRLRNLPRPLRLAYAGQCLRVRGSHLQPDRQISQAGIEMIGPDSAQADAEIILTAVEALAAVGLMEVSIDLTAPPLAMHLLDCVPDVSKSAVARALDRKDSSPINALGGDLGRTFLQLLAATGPAARAVPELLKVTLNDDAREHAIRLSQTVSAILEQRPDLPLTVDPVEFRGYQYHTGVCMTLFSAGRQAELGRGGRYLCADGQTATGVTLYPDTIVRHAPRQTLRRRVYLPFGTTSDDARRCREQNFATIAALAPDHEPVQEAARLQCAYIFKKGVIRPVSKDLP